MAATYTYIAPIEGQYEMPESHVRFLLGDTAPDPEGSLADEELTFLLAEARGNVRKAAAAGARRMALYYNKRAGVTSKSVAGLSLSYSYTTTAQAYLDLAKQLESGSTGEGITIQWAQDDDDTEDFTDSEFDNRRNFGFGSNESNWIL